MTTGDVPGGRRRYGRAEATIGHSYTDSLKRGQSSGRDQSALSTRAMETGSGKAWKRELGDATNPKQPLKRSRPSKLKGSDSKQRESGDDGSDGDGYKSALLLLR